jgi:hypothetical protein
MTDNIRAWRSGKKVTFPSGNEALLRRIDMLSIASSENAAPDFLSAMVRAGFSGENPLKEITAESATGFASALNWLCEQCFLEPKAGPDATDDQLAFYEIPFADKMHVFIFAMGREGAAAETFRQEQIAPVESTSASEDVSPTA